MKKTTPRERTQMQLRISPKEKRAWTKAAELDGYSNRSEWIRRTLNRAAKAIANGQ